ncbi:glycoside hydrolase family 10 protein [Prolixibacter sp. NT017]|uniref:glycoside hydrolase family 10 protein n=1 Tax=Prolixibacter sp. NT017 TaxID=2652390 RepID=UPI0012732396|nr:family 10 glycosylhydrolase [Prolixibacter sp. NT017]GET27617.1 UPF0748 protein YngK [Prolixibacter sp. NT017]
MKPCRHAFILFIAVLLSIPAFAGNRNPETPVPPKREFRGVWVATVANIDWPSKPGLPVAKQKQEIIDLLNMNKRNGMNAVIVQIRPSADAFYPSELEPWSKYLEGKQGVAPKPFYDPLAFFIKEAHKRGMEFHAWLNPYRVKNDTLDTLAASNIVNQHPDWAWNYGKKMYFDPGNPHVRDFVTAVVRDIVKRYDVDAIHFDDYFYPYRVANQEFPDSTTFKKYPRGFAPDQIDDWRRDNVDLIIQQLSKAIKEVKPWVKFGISPFGVWRNKKDDPDGSNTNAGTTNYDGLYADIIKWQREGWIDYTLPQLYWRIGHPLVDFDELAHWWARHTYGRSMYIGQAVYRLDKHSKIPDWRTPAELTDQIKMIRSIPGLEGSAWFSSKHFARHLEGFQKELRDEYYRTPAIVPTMPWIDDKAPDAPSNLQVEKVKHGREITWQAPQTDDEMNKARFFAVYRCGKNDSIDVSDPEYLIDVTGEDGYFVKRRFLHIFRKKYFYKVTTLDRLNNESVPSDRMMFKQ